MWRIHNGLLKLVLQHSVRSAVLAIRNAGTVGNKSNQASIDQVVVDKVCLIGPNPRVENILEPSDYATIFGALGDHLSHKIVHCEIHFYMSSRVALPAAALAVLLTRTRRLKSLLLNGMRISTASSTDMHDLSVALRDHPSLERVCLFNIAALHPHETSLRPLMEGITASRRIHTLVTKYCGWVMTASGLQSLSMGTRAGTLNAPALRILTLSGSRGLGHPALRMLSDALKTTTPTPNTSLRWLKELVITHCPLLTGGGRRMAEMLQQNASLARLSLELLNYPEALPLAKVLTQDISCYAHVNDRRSDGRALQTQSDHLFSTAQISHDDGRQSVWTCHTRNTTLTKLDVVFLEGSGSGLGRGHQGESNEDLLSSLMNAFELMLWSNERVVQCVLRSRRTTNSPRITNGGNANPLLARYKYQLDKHTTPQIDFLLGLNQAGIRRPSWIMTPSDDEAKSPHRQWIDFCIQNKDDPSRIYYILSHQPALLLNTNKQLVVATPTASAAAVMKKNHPKNRLHDRRGSGPAAYTRSCKRRRI